MNQNHFEVQVDPADRPRLQRRVRGLSLSQWLRGLINDDLEASGEPLLVEVVKPRKQRHGTTTEYNKYGCRCQDCRRAVITWQRDKRKRRLNGKDAETRKATHAEHYGQAE